MFDYVGMLIFSKAFKTFLIPGKFGYDGRSNLAIQKAVFCESVVHSKTYIGTIIFKTQWSSPKNSLYSDDIISNLIFNFCVYVIVEFFTTFLFILLIMPNNSQNSTPQKRTSIELINEKQSAKIAKWFHWKPDCTNNEYQWNDMKWN